MKELDGAGLLTSAQHPSPRKLARDDVACPHQLPYLKAALKVSLVSKLALSLLLLCHATEDLS